MTAAPGGPRRVVVVAALGVTQIFAWGSTFYLPAVLAQAIATDTGWPLKWVVGGLSAGLLVAGIVSPRVGRAISRRGGRPVLALGAVVLAIGLALLGAAQGLAWYIAAWLIVGAGMGAGLYDAAFATLGGIYGREARPMITYLTLIAGFASTVCWPLSAALVAHLGWRGTCLVYAAIQIVVALPIHLALLPRLAPGASTADGTPRADGALTKAERPVFVLVVTILTIGAAILSLMSAHLIALLQAGGVSLAAAVGLGALVGPAQVGARVIEMAGGKHYHPIWTMAGSAILVTAGVTLLLIGFPVLAVALVLYGAGSGIGSIARGTLPLALFGSDRYPVISGRIALPTLLAMALAPFVGALTVQFGGASLTFGFVVGLSLVNVGLIVILWFASKHILVHQNC